MFSVRKFSPYEQGLMAEAARSMVVASVFDKPLPTVRQRARQKAGRKAYERAQRSFDARRR